MLYHDQFYFNARCEDCVGSLMLCRIELKKYLRSHIYADFNLGF